MFDAKQIVTISKHIQRQWCKMCKHVCTRDTLGKTNMLQSQLKRPVHKVLWKHLTGSTIWVRSGQVTGGNGIVTRFLCINTAHLSQNYLQWTPPFTAEAYIFTFFLSAADNIICCRCFGICAAVIILRYNRRSWELVVRQGLDPFQSLCWSGEV